MASIALFTPNQTPQYLPSAHTPDYEGNPDAIINPNVSAVQNVPLKYWKRSGNTILEMTLAEKQSVDAAELQARKYAVTDPSLADLKSIFTALIKVINVRLSQNQKITKQEFIDAIKLEIT